MVRRNERFVVRGTIVEQETGRPLSDLVVRAYDEDVVFDDKVGFACSDADGRFEIHFGVDDFRDWAETAPDLYLRVYDATGSRLLHETRDAIRRNASRDEVYQIALPARALTPRRSG